MKAAVLRAYNQPVTIEDIDVADPGPREVRVRTSACGICHSDLHCLEGGLPVPLPTVLGHEPAGVVEAVGTDVTYVKPGDHVIACLSVFCGACRHCISGRPYLCGGAATMRGPGEPPRLSKDGEPLLQFAHLSGFAETMLLHENALVKIRPDMPLEQAALIGCGVTTGVGAALNTAKVEPGSTAVVIGCGGVGLSALQGSRIAGAARIIAVDTVPWKLDLASKLGATHTVDVSATDDPVAAVRELTDGAGADYAFECIGTPTTCQQAIGMVGAGGAAVMVGVVPIGQMVQVPMLDVVLQGKRILGSMMGENRFRLDMPRYVEFYLSGQLHLDEMISARIGLEGVNDAFEKMKAGEVARSVITFDA
jgi:S-(hydroxymethyl)glutathione dehydrogenase/alcohol dehydrogenase